MPKLKLREMYDRFSYFLLSRDGNL